MSETTQTNAPSQTSEQSKTAGTQVIYEPIVQGCTKDELFDILTDPEYNAFQAPLVGLKKVEEFSSEKDVRYN